MITFELSTNSLKKYDYIDVMVRVESPSVSNPFTDATVSAKFKLDNSEPIEVEGFCDSDDGTLYKIRFMPQQTGTYKYHAVYKQHDTEVTSEGDFTVVPLDSKGILKVDSDYPWHFKWEGTGEHYFWNGTTAYYLMGWDDANIHKIINRLANLKVNRIRVILYGRTLPHPWNQNVAPSENFKLHMNPWVAERPDDISNPGFDLNRFNLEHWRKYERLLEYARDKGVVISVVFFIAGGDIATPFDAYSKEEDLYYRYGVSRLGAFSNVTWDLGNEHDIHRDTPHWGNVMGHKVKGWDPYDHLCSAHNIEYRSPETDTSLDSKWIDMQMVQDWNEQQNDIMLDLRKKQGESGRIIPQVNEEYGYQDLWEDHLGQRSGESRRRFAWEIYMAGCYQTTGETTEHKGGFLSQNSGGGWINGFGDASMTMLIGYRHIVDFFTSFDWWKCQPHNELVSSEGLQPALCLADPGKVYVIYFREWTSSTTVKLTDDIYNAKWYNPRMDCWTEIETGAGPEWKALKMPSADDWVLFLERQSLKE